VALFKDIEGSKTVIVDYATGKVVQSLTNQNQATCSGGAFPVCELANYSAPQVYFAENGKTLCEAAAVGSFKNYPVCRDISTGKTIAEFRDVDGGLPASVSTGGARMVLSRLNYLPAANYRKNWGANTPGAETWAGRLVWDFRTGTEVAAWSSSTRPTAWLGQFGAASGLSAPWASISPLGRYVAEVLGDELHIYEVP
jgi:hypothetical protein